MLTIVHVIKVFGDDEKLVRNMDVMVSGVRYMCSVRTNSSCRQGMRHSMLNLPPRHFAQLGADVLYGLREVLGDKLTPEKESAWGALYTILSGMLQSRMKQYNKDIGYTMNLT